MKYQYCYYFDMPQIRIGYACTTKDEVAYA